MLYTIARWLITTVAILIVPQIVSGVQVSGFGTALAAAIILGVLNAVVRPVLIILTLPLTVVTLGFFILVINALLFQLAGWLLPGLKIASFWSAFAGALIVSIVSWILSLAVVDDGKVGRRVVVYRRGGDHTYDMHRGSDGKWE